MWKMENSLSDAIPLAFLCDFLFKLFLLPREQGTVEAKSKKNLESFAISANLFSSFRLNNF